MVLAGVAMGAVAVAGGIAEAGFHCNPPGGVTVLFFMFGECELPMLLYNMYNVNNRKILVNEPVLLSSYLI